MYLFQCICMYILNFTFFPSSVGSEPRRRWWQLGDESSLAWSDDGPAAAWQRLPASLTRRICLREFILSGLKAVMGASDSRPFYGLMNTFIFQIYLIPKIHARPFQQEGVGAAGGGLGGPSRLLHVMGNGAPGRGFN